jgi:hypothetical protein
MYLVGDASHPQRYREKYIMALYTITNDKTDETEDLFCTYEDLQNILEKRGEPWRQVIGTPGFVSHTGNIVNKTSGDWKDLLKGIKKGSGRGTNINT